MPRCHGATRVGTGFAVVKRVAKAQQMYRCTARVPGAYRPEEQKGFLSLRLVCGSAQEKLSVSGPLCVRMRRHDGHGMSGERTMEEQPTSRH